MAPLKQPDQPNIFTPMPSTSKDEEARVPKNRKRKYPTNSDSSSSSSDVAVDSLLFDSPKSKLKNPIKSNYSAEEDETIVRFIKEKGYFKLRGGTAIWKELEEKDWLPNRTWQSLKNRFLRYILNTKGTEFFEQEDDEKLYESMMASRRSDDGIYTMQEDKNILKYIIDNRRAKDVKGVALWTTMEARNVCTDRTWQSMKERYLKRILKNIDDYRLTDEQKELLRI